MTTKEKNGNGFPALLSEFFDNNKLFKSPWFENEFRLTMPPVNIKETETAYDVEFAAPGFSKNDFKVEVENGMVTVSAEKKQEKKEEKDKFTRKEFSYNSFSRSFNLPSTVNSDKIDANYNNGILKLCVPKKVAEKAKNKKEIKVA